MHNCDTSKVFDDIKKIHDNVSKLSSEYITEALSNLINRKYNDFKSQIEIKFQTLKMTFNKFSSLSWR